MIIVSDSAATGALLARATEHLRPGIGRRRHGQLGAGRLRRSERRRSRKLGVGWVDAPVSGGPPAAQTGSLAIMAGASQGDFELVASVLASARRQRHARGRARGRPRDEGRQPGDRRPVHRDRGRGDGAGRGARVRPEDGSAGSGRRVGGQSPGAGPGQPHASARVSARWARRARCSRTCGWRPGWPTSTRSSCRSCGPRWRPTTSAAASGAGAEDCAVLFEAQAQDGWLRERAHNIGSTRDTS